jgi:hypothetical protein
VPWVRLSLWKWVPGISAGVKAAGAFGWRPTTLVVPKFEKIRGLNLPVTPWATSACRGRHLLYIYIYAFIHAFTFALLINSNNGPVTQICTNHVDLIECTTVICYSSVSLYVNHIKRCGFCTCRLPLRSPTTCINTWHLRFSCDSKHENLLYFLTHNCLEFVMEKLCVLCEVQNELLSLCKLIS